MKSNIRFDSNNFIIDIDIVKNQKSYPLLSLNMRMLIFLFIIISVLVIVSCSEKDEDTNLLTDSFSGVVKDFSSLDGCGLLIELDNGEIINPVIINNSNITLEANQAVEITYKEVDSIETDCMKGINAIVTILDINECENILFNHVYDTLPNDDFEINYAKINEDCLEINISHGGGCENHEYILAKIDPWCGTPPLPPTTLELRHNANNDMCEAYLTHSVLFDLTSIQNPDSTSLQIILKTNIDDYSETLIYNY